ncbi:type II CRISPR-associated endonuclease Cas1 [Prolixibacter sp. SD074]|uniref:type II CRISPR-associated endonuclease Cas1 n=1 Tax=Prolixibacter sp. SD074 TaxID=2652391 RepID=UPI0012775DFD|nr:type II CRISPR-associated endonuclease Cas1 [Prolixibacter sp. SD074]GET28219.1 CRISPR-associated endonuclease Cas1 [Prolixibacter sp. SD074]
MLKRTLFFSNPYYLSLKNNQLVIQSKDELSTKTVPVEDIGFVVLDHPQIGFSMKLLEILNANNVAVVFCDSKHMPSSMLLNLDSHSLQNELFRAQLSATEPLRKNLWKQTIEAKINNQATMLEKSGHKAFELRSYAKSVKSGDVENREGLAARIYWNRLLGNDFYRDRYGAAPNHLLNYGYILLRSAVARALSGSGLLPTLGIHHHNRYNAFCLADDIMEPYRPYVDRLALLVYSEFPDETMLNKEMKAAMLNLMSIDVVINDNKRPLMVALSQTTASLGRCFSGESRKIVYPVFN